MKNKRVYPVILTPADNIILVEVPDMETFRGLPMAIQASREGGSMPTVFNAANELAVKKFLEEKIGFLDIYEIIAIIDSNYSLFKQLFY